MFEEREDSKTTTNSAQEDFRIPECTVEVVDEGDDEGDGDGGENAFPYHLRNCFLPTLRKSTLNHYLEVDEEDQ